MPHLHLSLRNDDGEPREIISQPLTDPEALDLLRSADIAGSQLVPWGSNYTFAVLFATFAITYRYSMWLQRPPTALYWKRGWQVFFRPKYLAGNIANWFARVPAEFGANLFILRRDRFRWGAHMLIMWGCIAAVSITFPLVFGWVHFETLPNDLNWYRAYLSMVWCGPRSWLRPE